MKVEGLHRLNRLGALAHKRGATLEAHIPIKVIWVTLAISTIDRISLQMFFRSLGYHHDD